MAANAPLQESCPECFSTDLAWLLSQASFALTREVSAAFEPLGVSPRGYHVLAAAANGSFTQKELADRVGLDKTTMVATIDELEAAGLAERKPSKSDRRARVIAVTAAGKRKVAQGMKVVEQVQADVLDSLPAGERRAFVSALSRLVGERLAEPVECKRPLRRPRAA